ncbi:hypothetical protein ACWGKQ_22955 [Streptomyces sp. NPDC054770]
MTVREVADCEQRSVITWRMKSRDWVAPLVGMPHHRLHLDRFLGSVHY